MKMVMLGTFKFVNLTLTVYPWQNKAAHTNPLPDASRKLNDNFNL